MGTYPQVGESADLELELADSSTDFNADPQKIGMSVRAFIYDNIESQLIRAKWFL